MKTFFAKKSVGFYATAAAAVLGIIAVILFATSRENNSTAIVGLLAAGLVCSALIAVKHVKLTEYIPLVLNAVALGMIFKVLLDNLADIFAKNNVLGLSSGFIASMIFCLLAAVGSIVAVICKHEK